MRKSRGAAGCSPFSCVVSHGALASLASQVAVIGSRLRQT
jgi:hypothetical protein